MIYKQNSEHINCESDHPYEPFNVEDAKSLIVGSIPPYRFSGPKNLLCGDIDWYYGSKDNSFWDILKESFDKNEISLCAKENQQKFFSENKIGIFDMIKKCTRKNECGSSDTYLYNIESIDACEIISKNKDIELKLFFTSIFVADLFNRQIQANIDTKKRTFQEITICNKNCKVMILYSPSPSWSRGLRELRGINKEYKNNIRITQYKKIFS